MHIKIDEDLWKDPALWEAVQDHQQFFLTADKGFGNIRRYPPGTHGGILLLRPSEDGIQPLLDLLEQVLAMPGEKQLSGSVFLLRPR